MPSRSRLRHAVLVVLGAVACLAFGRGASAQPALQSLPGLTQVAFYEMTSTRTRTPYVPTAPQLLTRRSGALGPGNFDFSYYTGEYYDVFYSNADGSPNPLGAYLTIESVWYGNAGDGGMNITAIELVAPGGTLLADRLLGSVVGSRCIPAGCRPESALLAVDDNLGTFPRMGATDPNDPNDRMRLTVGFSRLTVAPPPTLAPIAPTTPGGQLALAWSNTGAPSYTVAVVGGPGIGAPLGLGTFACCSQTFGVPAGIAPGTYLIVVSGGGSASAPTPAVIQGTGTSVPTLAPVAPAAPGGLLTFTWNSNGASHYALAVVGGPGIPGPFGLGGGSCCSLMMSVPAGTPPGIYQVVVSGGGVTSAPVNVEILGPPPGPFALSASTTTLGPGLQITLSWTDRLLGPAPYRLFVAVGDGPFGQFGAVPCCSVTVRGSGVPPGGYRVYVRDAHGVASNTVTVTRIP